MSANVRYHANNFFRTLDQKLEPPVKSHLKQVYSNIALATFAAASGSYVHLFTNFSGGFFNFILAAIAAAGFVIALVMTPDNGKNTQKRLTYLMGFAVATGLLTGPMIEMAIHLNPMIVPMSLVSTFLVFASFTLSSIFSNHSKWIYMGGGLMSMLSVMLFMSVINLFIGSYYLYQAQQLLGVIVLCVFVMYDTATIIEKRRMGDTDHILHATLLFADFIDLFQRFLTILMQKERRNRSNRR